MLRMKSKNVFNKYKLMSGGNKFDIKRLPMNAGNIKDKRDRGNRGTLHSEQYIYSV